jgi:hypothetical protein
MKNMAAEGVLQSYLMLLFSFLAETSLANGLGDRSRVSSRSLITDALFSHTK